MLVLAGTELHYIGPVDTVVRNLSAGNLADTAVGKPVDKRPATAQRKRTQFGPSPVSIWLWSTSLPSS